MGHYSRLRNTEYREFEDDKYAKIANEATHKAGLGIHNCADLLHMDTQIKQFGVDVYSLVYYPQIEGSPFISKVIEDGYSDNCTIFENIDSQLFMRTFVEEMEVITRDLCQEAKIAMCKKSLNSHFAVASGCEVPPDLECKIENITVVMDATHKYGRFD